MGGYKTRKNRRMAHNDGEGAEKTRSDREGQTLGFLKKDTL